MIALDLCSTYVSISSAIIPSSIKAMLVHTSETVRYRYFVDLLMEHRRPVMLVGNAGCGKTVLINDKLSSKYN